MTMSGGAGPTSLKDAGMLSLVSCITRLRAVGFPYALATKKEIKKAGESFMGGGGEAHFCFSRRPVVLLYVVLSRGHHTSRGFAVTTRPMQERTALAQPPSRIGQKASKITAKQGAFPAPRQLWELLEGCTRYAKVAHPSREL